MDLEFAKSILSFFMPHGKTSHLLKSIPFWRLSTQLPANAFYPLGSTTDRLHKTPTATDAGDAAANG